MRLWREARFEVKMVKTPQFGALLEVEMFKTCMALWCGAHFEVNMFEGSLDVEFLTTWTGGQAEARKRQRRDRVRRQKMAPEGEKVELLKRPARHTVVARSTRENAKNTTKCQNHTMLEPLLEVELIKNCMPLCTKHLSKSKCSNTTCLDQFSMSNRHFSWQAQGIQHPAKK